MRIIHWNAGYSSNMEKVFDLITRSEADLVFLLEVTPAKYEYLKTKTDSVIYSLDYRKPGKYDSKGRKLGIVLLHGKDVEIVKTGVFDRALLPERTLWANILYKDKPFKAVAFHSITGCDHKKAKSLFFNSMAEAVDDYKPDIVTIDANEPSKDFYTIEGMEFYNRNGDGARNLFNCIKDNGLVDSYAVNYDQSQYIEGQPLTPSHYVQHKKNNAKRYDFVFINTDKLKVDKSEYLMDEALEATGDHAVVRVDVDG